MIFYLDESSNTGNNWNDKTQPFFTYGGWIISEDKIEKAISIIEKFASKHQGELKSKSFVSRKGMKKVIDLSKELMAESNAVPYFMCFEKSYMIACKAVEIFFDHKTNCKVNGYLTFPNEYEYFRVICRTKGITEKYEDVKHFLPPIKITKKGLAEIISSDESLCTYIGDVINNKVIDENCVDNIVDQMASLFYKHGLEEVSKIFEIDNFNKKEIYEALIGKELQNELLAKVSKKSILLQPSLYEMMQNLKKNYTDLKLVVDTLGTQNSQFEEISMLLEVPIEIKEESEKDFMIMASDLLVGHIARLVKDIINNFNFVEESDVELLKCIITKKKSVFEYQSSLWYLKVSERSGDLFLNKLGYPTNSNNFKEILESSFHEFIK